MQKVTTKFAIAKVAAVATGLAMATSMLSLAPIAHAATLTDAQVSSILSLLTSFGANAATIANVQGALTGVPSTSTSGSTTTTTGTSACSFSRNLTIGSTGADVTCLQNALIGGGFSIAAGATGYFGTQTRTAVASWQSSKNIAPAVGYFGSISRAAFNLGGGSSSTTTTTTTTTGTTAGTGNGLKVSLATDSPNNVALVQGQAVGSLAKFTFANPTATDVKVTNLGFKRIGVSNDSTLSNVYIYNGTKRLTDSAGVSNTAFNFNDPTGLFTVAAGQTYTVSVLADIAGSTSGQQVGVQLTAVTSNGTLDSSVAFPVNGYTQTVSAATLATADFASATTPAVNTSLTPQNDQTIWQNTVTIGTRAVTLSSFEIRNLGSIKSTDINNIRLYVDGVQTGGVATINSVDNTVSWDLSAKPLRLETGSRIVKAVGDVIGGSSLTFQFSLRRASDAQMIDTDLNQPILATADSATFSARSSGIQTISTGTVSTVKANNSPSSNVSLNATNVKWASFELRAAGEDMKIDNLNVQADTSVSVRGLDNGKVFLNGIQVGSTKDLTGNTDVNFTFGSSFILKAGTTAIVDVYADAKSTTGASFLTSETALITLALGSSNGQGQVSLATVNTPTADVTGNTITVSSASATATKYSGYSNTSLIAGTNNAKMGSFTLSTGSTEGMNVNTLTVTLSSDESASITDLKLVDNATGLQIGSTKTSPSTSNAISVNFDMAASATKVINIVANIKSGANAGAWTAAIDGTGTGTNGSSITFGGSTTALQTITLTSAVLTAAIGVSPDNANVIAGTSMVKVGTFNFTSQYSGYTIDKINVKVPANAATAVSSVTLKYPDVNGVTQSSSQNISVSSGGQSHATSTFTGLTFYVPAGMTKQLDAYVNLSSIQNDGDSGKTVTVTLDFDEGFNATDSSGTADTSLASADIVSSDTSGKGTIVVRKSVPTLSAVALSTSALSNGSNKILGRVKVTADAAGDIGWDKIAFTVSKTSPSNLLTIGATSTLALWDGSNQIAGTFATTTGNLLGGLDAMGILTSATLTFVPTSEQSISAGQSATYDLKGTIGGFSGAGGYTLDVSVANAQTTASTTATAAQVGNAVGSTPSFTWSDKSSVASVHSTTTSDWTDDYLIKALPLTIGTLTGSL